MTEIAHRTVLTDMDGVVAGFDERVVDIMEAEEPRFQRLDERVNFYVADDYPEHTAVMRAIARRPGFFQSLPVMQGAIEGWQRMMELGYHPRICSSPILTNPTSREEKLGWLEEHFAPVFGMGVVDEAIITREKHLQDGIALIDDRPGIHQADEAPWQYMVFDQPYNEHYLQGEEHLRLYGWDDPELSNKLAYAQQVYRGIGGSAMGGVS